MRIAIKIASTAKNTVEAWTVPPDGEYMAKPAALPALPAPWKQAAQTEQPKGFPGPSDPARAEIAVETLLAIQMIIDGGTGTRPVKQFSAAKLGKIMGIRPMTISTWKTRARRPSRGNQNKIFTLAARLFG